MTHNLQSVTLRHYLSEAKHRPNGGNKGCYAIYFLLLTITWQLSKFSYLLLLLNIGHLS